MYFFKYFIEYIAISNSESNELQKSYVFDCDFLTPTYTYHKIYESPLGVYKNKNIWFQIKQHNELSIEDDVADNWRECDDKESHFQMALVYFIYSFYG